MIYRIQSYIDDKGRTLREDVPNDPESFEAKRYTGRAYLRAQTPGGPMQEHPIEFQIDAKGIEEAFEKFDAAARAEMERVKTLMLGMARPQIVVPNGPVKGLVTP